MEIPFSKILHYGDCHFHRCFCRDLHYHDSVLDPHLSQMTPSYYVGGDRTVAMFLLIKNSIKQYYFVLLACFVFV